jgi:hypothetical protein
MLRAPRYFYSLHSFLYLTIKIARQRQATNSARSNPIQAKGANNGCVIDQTPHIENPHIHAKLGTQLNNYQYHSGEQLIFNRLPGDCPLCRSFA